MWVLAPFGCLIVLGVASKRWSFSMRRALSLATMLVAPGAMAGYALDAIWPFSDRAAVPYVTIPPVMYLIVTFVLTLIFRRHDTRS
jgi:hypothetical protein